MLTVDSPRWDNASARDAAAERDAEIVGIDVDVVIDLARARTEMDAAWLSSFSDETQVLDVVSSEPTSPVCAGAMSDIEGSYCIRVIEGRLPNIIRDARHHPITSQLPVTEELDIGSYIGVPVMSHDSRPLGMLCCVSATPADHLGDAHVETLKAFAAVLAEMLERGSLLRRSSSFRQRSADRIRSDLAHVRAVYQPIVNPHAGRAIGVEALCRIDRGDVRVEEWFNDAAAVGLGIEAELAALRAAFTRLPDLPVGLTLSVNISPSAIGDPRILQLLAENSPERLIVEITEHQKITDYHRFAKDLDPLRALGIRIAVDDVGAGFATFAHVLELRPDVLKLDRSIVAGIDRDPAREAIAAALVDLGRRIDARVVAEGVETLSELNTAAAAGIEVAQGYLFCRPGPLEQVLERVEGATLGFTGGDGIDLTPGRHGLRFDLTMEHSPIGIALVTIDGRFELVNPALARILGASMASLVGSPTVHFSHPDELGPDGALLASCLAEERDSYARHKQFRRLDGVSFEAFESVVLVRSPRRRPLYFIAQIQPLI